VNAGLSEWPVPGCDTTSVSRLDHLFNESHLSDVLRNQEQMMERAAQDIPPDHALARSVEELAAELVAKFRIEPLVIDGAALTMSHHDEKVDVSRDPTRFIRDPSQPFFIPGTRITYHVPIGGEEDLFKFQPSTFTLNPPIGEVSGGELRISIAVPTPVPASIKDQMDRTLASIVDYAQHTNADVAAFNAKLEGVARAAAERRRDKVIADHDLAASFGIPVRRQEAPKTYAAPPVRRSVTRSPPTKGTTARPLEPVLPAEDYEHILSVARQMVAVIERSPASFRKMREEDLRQHFLVQLNGQYEGDATGETFNFEGRTDILIRRDGRNLFIAECKFWGGAKVLTGTIDQLLSYASWRDTKTAIFIFNRAKDLSKVLAQISPTVAAHPSFVREISYGGETDFRFVIRHRDDPERELTLSVLVFEVPGE
jgi:hypothetical protein